MGEGRRERESESCGLRKMAPSDEEKRRSEIYVYTEEDESAAAATLERLYSGRRNLHADNKYGP